MIARMRGGGHQPGDVVVHTRPDSLYTQFRYYVVRMYTHTHTKNWIQPTTKKQLNVRDELVKR